MTRAAKVRADVALVARGLADSRARAQALIMAGLVTSGDRRVDKAGARLPADAELTVRRPDHPWVSRGGVKLAHGLEHFAIYPTNRHGIRLRKRYGKDRDSLFTFMTERAVPPTNNGSERDMRPTTIFRKVANGFRSEWGSELYAGVRSLDPQDRPPTGPFSLPGHPGRHRRPTLTWTGLSNYNR